MARRVTVTGREAVGSGVARAADPVGAARRAARCGLLVEQRAHWARPLRRLSLALLHHLHLLVLHLLVLLVLLDGLDHLLARVPRWRATAAKLPWEATMATRRHAVLHHLAHPPKAGQVAPPAITATGASAAPLLRAEVGRAIGELVAAPPLLAQLGRRGHVRRAVGPAALRLGLGQVALLRRSRHLPHLHVGLLRRSRHAPHLHVGGVDVGPAR